ncbi:Lrp/AsnC family transcriptional regulator [Falsirhodobacter halotolerans]|uniref:Lrp/AsnC family transcriptional regulator n=1 Tax=Falsirhodobacter halotolerans TaxID=1146892 RepID=UPI001FD3283F|nr:Lrp/AsnC family transcriptional regulator [Falsirhodobacter halotolerans]MCJ8141207.1 Lrp/AsnC family transcriptional regulator [Falsirhodobacter halotolerans]
MLSLDTIDRKILTVLQQDGTLSQRDVAERVGMSQNACWRRLQRLRDAGVILGSQTRIDPAKAGLDLTVFVMIRTRHHSADWAEAFRKHVDGLPGVVDCYRIGGEWDYLIKVVTRGMGGYDAFYQRLITGFDFHAVTGIFSMETILESHPLDLTRPA